MNPEFLPLYSLRSCALLLPIPVHCCCYFLCTLVAKSCALLIAKNCALLFADYTIEVAAKIAEELGVSLDYLTGHSDLELDKAFINRIVDVQKLNEDDRKTLFTLMDAFLRDAKARKAYAS